MNRKLIRILTYIKMSLLFLVLAAFVLYFAGGPLASYVLAKGNMIITQGAPGWSEGNESYEAAKKLNGILNKSKIDIPEPDTQYAVITCERIALAAPVYYGDSQYSLQHGAGQYISGTMPGEGKPVLISGHDGTYFAPLQNIIKGDVVKLTAFYGELEYIVTGTAVADAKDTKVYDLTQDKEQLILYTCYPFGKLLGDRTERYFVYCDRIADAAAAAQ